jgi:hypothetical protein
MAWAISTGSSWSFGIICTRGPDQGYAMYRLETMVFDLARLNDEDKGTIDTIFWTLAYWVIALIARFPLDSIMNSHILMFFKLQSSTPAAEILKNIFHLQTSASSQAGSSRYQD